MRTHLTKKFLDGLPNPPKGKRTRVYDDSVTGFAAVKLPSGVVRFTLDYGPREHRRRVVIGTLKPPGEFTLKEAQTQATITLGEVRKGADPLADQVAKRNEMTFTEWKNTYLDIVRERKKSWRDDERYLGRAAKSWRSIRLGSLSTEAVEKAFQQTRIERGKISANRFLASVRACLQEAWRRNLVIDNVAARVKFLPENPPRPRTLTPDEFQRVLQAIAELPDPFERAAITLIIETGCRKSEALAAKWEDVDLDAGTWRIPSPKAGCPQAVPLAGTTVALLRNLERVSNWIIPGRHRGRRRADVRTVWARVRKSAGAEDVTVHDLRRTFGLEAVRTVGLHKASKLLRHSRTSVTELVYAPLGLDELRQATEKVAQTRAKVLKMRGR